MSLPNLYHSLTVEIDTLRRVARLALGLKPLDWTIDEDRLSLTELITIRDDLLVVISDILRIPPPTEVSGNKRIVLNESSISRVLTAKSTLHDGLPDVYAQTDRSEH